MGSPAPDRRPEPSTPPLRRWGPSLVQVERARQEIREQLRGRRAGASLRAAARPGRVPDPDLVPTLRLLSRRALFTGQDRPPARERTEMLSPHGITVVLHQPLSWTDARTMLLVQYMFRVTGGAGASPKLRLSPAVLARMLRASEANGEDSRATGEAIEQMEASLQRLLTARIQLLDANGDPEPDLPVTPFALLERDDGPRADAHSFRLPEWLHARLRAGLADARTGAVEFSLPWPVLRKLQGRALLLYLYLECEDLRRWERVRHPVDPSSSEWFRRRYQKLTPGFLGLLGLETAEPNYMRRELRRAARVVWARDQRYEFVDVPHGGNQLCIHKREGGPQPDLYYTGTLCRACQRPDPHGVCCCAKRTAQGPCEDERCPRCQEAF